MKLQSVLAWKVNVDDVYSMRNVRIFMNEKCIVGKVGTMWLESVDKKELQLRVFLDGLEISNKFLGVCNRQVGEFVSCGQWIEGNDRIFVGLGTSSGRVCFCDIRGRIVYDKVFLNAPVLRIKFVQNGKWLCLIYKRGIILLETEKLVDLLMDGNFDEEVLPESIFKHFRLTGQKKINDLIVVSEKDEEKSLFDQMEDNSSNNPVFICVGDEPSIARFKPEKIDSHDDSKLSLSNIKNATQYAAKVTTSVWSNLFGRAKTNIEKPKQQSESTLRSMYSFNDSPRDILYIETNPLNPTYAVTTDSLNRVMILETSTCIVTQILKGYRNARCALLTVANESHILINTSRGILEDWNVDIQHKPTTCTQMRVPKNSLLVQSIQNQWFLFAPEDNQYHLYLISFS